MGGGASREAALRNSAQQKEKAMQSLLGLEWKASEPLRSKDVITRVIVNPYGDSLGRWNKGAKYQPTMEVPRGKRVPMRRVVNNMTYCIERVAKEMHLDTNFLKDCFDMLGGYPVHSSDPRRCGKYPYRKGKVMIGSEEEKFLEEDELKMWVAACSVNNRSDITTENMDGVRTAPHRPHRPPHRGSPLLARPTPCAPPHAVPGGDLRRAPSRPSVLSHMPSRSQVRPCHQVFTKLLSHREDTDRSIGPAKLRRADWKDFLVLTYDYYLAFGTRHMHAVFHDLIKT